MKLLFCSPPLKKRQTAQTINGTCQKTDEGVREMTRPTFKDFKAKALDNPAVREEYEALAAVFAVKRQLIGLRHQAGLTQEQMAERLGTQKAIFQD